MRRGEVWWYEEPEEPPRPWLILTRDEAIDRLKKILAAPATRTVHSIPTEVPVGLENGMPHDGVINLDNVTPIDKALLIERITTLGPDKMSAVCRALAHATAC